MSKSNNSKGSSHYLDHISDYLNTFSLEKNVARNYWHQKEKSQVDKRKHHDCESISCKRKSKNDKLTCKTHHKNEKWYRKELIHLKISNSCCWVKLKYYTVIHFIGEKCANYESHTNHWKENEEGQFKRKPNNSKVFLIDRSLDWI